MSDTVILYGLANCDSCRKARKMMEERSLTVDFVDVRKSPLTAEVIGKIIASAGWERVLNRKSTTWRGLNNAQKSDMDAAKATELIARYPALMKRPVIVAGPDIYVGFDEAVQNRLSKS